MQRILIFSFLESVTEIVIIFEFKKIQGTQCTVLVLILTFHGVLQIRICLTNQHLFQCWYYIDKSNVQQIINIGCYRSPQSPERG